MGHCEYNDYWLTFTIACCIHYDLTLRHISLVHFFSSDLFYSQCTLFRCLFKLFQWRLSDDDEDGHISSRQVGTFASSDPAQVEYLFETVRDILRSGLVNTSLQQRICAKSSSPHANDQIDKFNTLEYHDEFNEWLFRVRLVDSGFIIYRNQTVQPNSMNENSLTLSSSSSSIIH